MAPESVLVLLVLMVLPLESVLVASATRIPKEVLMEVVDEPAASVVVTVTVSVAVVEAVHADHVVHGAEVEKGPSVQPKKRQ